MCVSLVPYAPVCQQTVGLNCLPQRQLPSRDKNARTFPAKQGPNALLVARDFLSQLRDQTTRMLRARSGSRQYVLPRQLRPQGFYLGEHGWFDKRFIFDESFKTPLLAISPFFKYPGEETSQTIFG